MLQGVNLGDDIYFDTLNKAPYAQEVLSYNSDFERDEESTMDFETDLLVYEKADIIKSHIIIESKINSITTHDAITYIYKAQTHKNVTPYIRYGIMLGNRKHYPLPGRLFRHGTNFDLLPDVLLASIVIVVFLRNPDVLPSISSGAILYTKSRHTGTCVISLKVDCIVYFFMAIFFSFFSFRA